MRLFIATPITLPLYSFIKDELKDLIVGNWTLASNLHLTHYFIGKGDPEKYKFKLDIPKEKIIVKDFDFFNNKIFYMKAFCENINKINSQICDILNTKSNFKPHITLCRIKQIKNKDKVFDKLEDLKKKNLKFKNNFEVFLYSSTLTPKGPIYKKIYKYK